MWLIQRFHELHTALQNRQRGLCALLTACLYLSFFVALPISLTGFEDNVDGLRGYPTFFIALALAGAILVGLAAWLLYRFSPPRARTVYIAAALALLLIAVVFGFVYQTNAGMLDNFMLSQPEALRPSATTFAVDAAILLLCSSLAVYLLSVHPSWVANGLAVLILADLGMSAVSLYSLHERTSRKSEEVAGRSRSPFSYTKQGKNVLLVFVDGAMTGYLSDIFRDEPSLPAKLAGFTWYSNVVSTGNRTLNGLPPVFGGFDYTVSAINHRPGHSLKEKVSNAYKLYVENFSRHGYQVLYADPFWFGLERKGDCELFNELYERTGQGRCIHYIGKQVADKKAQVRGGRSAELFAGLAKQYFALSLFKIAPHSLKQRIYANGEWLGLSYAWKTKEDKYLNNYFSLTSLGEFSDASAQRDTFTFITTELTRAPLFVREDCIPDRRLTPSDGRIAPLMRRYHGDRDTVAIYQTTRCAVRGIAKFMDWLRANGIYDNTMVVLASDHGWLSRNPLLESLGSVKSQVRYSMFQAFLMVKGFNSSSPLAESREFIANASVPGMICDVIGGCLDRATGKTVHHQPLLDPVLLHETPWQARSQKRDSFIVEALYSVKEDITKPGNWREIMPPRRKTP